MKRLIFLSVMLATTFAMAGDKNYQTGSLKEMNSVECGVEAKSGTTFVGDLLGTDSNHTQTRKTFCQEYVLETPQVIYHIRPHGDDKHPALLPVGQSAQFRMKKDRMVLRVPEGDNKEREYDVIAAAPVDKVQAATTAKK